MPQNGINKAGIAALADAFAANKNLTHINLNDNTFTKTGALAMAKVSASSKLLAVGYMFFTQRKEWHFMFILYIFFF